MSPRCHRFAPYAVLIFCAVAWSSTVVGTAHGEPPQRVSRQILAEEQRQNDVTHRVGDIAARFRELISDLSSNGFIEESHSRELLAAVDVLSSVNEKHVRAAIRSLQQARQMPADASIHLAKADAEVEIVVQQLTDLLRLAKTVEANQLLRQEVRGVVRQEETLWTTTKSLGRDLLAGKPAAAEVKDLGAAQREATERAAKLRAMFSEAAKNAATPEEQESIRKAGELFTQRQVDGLLTSAARNIEQQSLVDAVTQQKEAIAALRLIDRLLETGSLEGNYDREEIREQLKQLLEKQRDLRERTEQAPPSEFSAQRRPLQGEQRELRDEIGEVNPKSLDPAEADAAMKLAEAALDAARQQDATRHQRQAESALERAMATLDKNIAAQAALPAQDTPAGPAKSPGQPAAPAPAEMTARSNLTQGIEPKAAELSITKLPIAGSRPETTRSTWQSLGRREQEPLGEQYIQQLPLEYRQLLKDYFEALSK